MKNYLIVVDMQNDFVTGVLGTPEAVAIVPALKQRVEAGLKAGEEVLFTRDIHGENYLTTQEGRKLPVPHCLKNSKGGEIIDELKSYAKQGLMFDKSGFGSVSLAEQLAERKDDIGNITLVGLCTDICVICNAMLLKAFLPETEIIVEASCCAGVTPEGHRTALEAMKTCQITVKE